MKKFLVVIIIVLFSTNSVTAQSDSAIIATFAPTIERICNATMKKIGEKLEKEEIGSKEDDLYVYYKLDGTQELVTPKEGEEMLKFKGKLFYSMTYHCVVEKYKAPKVEKSPEQKAQRNQVLANVISTVGGAIINRVNNSSASNTGFAADNGFYQ